MTRPAPIQYLTLGLAKVLDWIFGRKPVKAGTLPSDFVAKLEECFPGRPFVLIQGETYTDQAQLDATNCIDHRVFFNCSFVGPLDFGPKFFHAYKCSFKDIDKVTLGVCWWCSFDNVDDVRQVQIGGGK